MLVFRLHEKSEISLSFGLVTSLVCFFFICIIFYRHSFLRPVFLKIIYCNTMIFHFMFIQSKPYMPLKKPLHVFTEGPLCTVH